MTSTSMPQKKNGFHSDPPEPLSLLPSSPVVARGQASRHPVAAIASTAATQDAAATLGAATFDPFAIDPVAVALVAAAIAAIAAIAVLAAHAPMGVTGGAPQSASSTLHTHRYVWYDCI